VRIRSSGQGGYALVFALLMVVVLSLGATVAVRHQRQEAQRQREAQLLWVGDQYRAALQSYYALQVQGKSFYPEKLEDLLEDRRMPNTLRHLRQLYPDPITDRFDWELELEGGRIVGLHSPSELMPIRANGPGGTSKTIRSYADWHFKATDALEVASAVPSAPGVATGGAPATTGSTGQDNPADEPAPAPPPPPNDARTQCNLQFSNARVRCRGPDFPMGSDPFSCQSAMLQALLACYQAAGP
jgi:type II secretory pathway pseudopilin PulG